MPHTTHGSTSTTATALSLTTSSHRNMSRPSSTSTNPGNTFPRPAGMQLLPPDPSTTANGDPLSPAASHFSFASSPPSVHDDEADDTVAPDVPSRNMRSLTRGTTGDPRGELRAADARSRAQFYEDSFAYKGVVSSTARERVIKDAPIVAELRTNVIIKDEYTLVTDLSHHLSTRYQRPEASIMITVNHSACLLLGGSFEPTYVLTINALPVQLQPTTNKRNAALIQQFMYESIGVALDRGVVKFVPIPEDSFAMNGTTILGDIERLERKQADEAGGGGGGGTVKRAVTRSSRRSVVSRAKSSIQLSRNSSKTYAGKKLSITPPMLGDGLGDTTVAVNEQGVVIEEEETTPAAAAAAAAADKPLSPKKSEPLLSKFGKRAPKDMPASKQLVKHKSFLHVFRR